MQPGKYNTKTLARMQQLIVSTFAGRDELYAAAASLDDETRQQVCRRLAEHLAGYASELQQIVMQSGCDPAEPLDLNAIAAALFDLAKVNRGEDGVLAAAAEGESDLKEEYDQAIDEASHPEAANIMRRHREGVEFSEQVLRGMRPRRDE